MARKTGDTKSQRIAKSVAEAVQAGKEWNLLSVDFTDPNRPKTCLEVDFPILFANRNAAVESSSGAAVQPVYKASKWWARRPASVFRAILIAAASKAPDDPTQAAKLVSDAYYGNHGKNDAFGSLKVADVFMGGGTTIVEGAKLGMQMHGNDLNPVAWFVVKNALAKINPTKVQQLLSQIEAEVKPQIMPFYACDCPRGHKGHWTHKSSRRKMGPNFNPLVLTSQERLEYEYEGPEIIYTFWSKHGPCQDTECKHRTPIMSSPVVALKTLSVEVWRNKRCTDCEQIFDVEAQDTRMAPAALFVCSPEERPYSIRNEDGTYDCPHCGFTNMLALGSTDKKDKKIELTLLVHPEWLKGSPAKDRFAREFGGCVTDNAENTALWNAERARTLRHIEVRGPLPEEIECPDTNEMFRTDAKGGTVPKKSTFTCMEATCGKPWDILDSIKKTKKSGPVSMYAVQGYCPSCDKAGKPYSGRFFDLPQVQSYDVAYQEWEQRRDADLASYWPRSEVPFGFMTSMNNGGIPNHGFTHWWTMFNPKQLLILSQLLRSIDKSGDFDWEVREIVLGAFQQYLRFNCLFTVYHTTNDQTTKHFANNNYAPKSTILETAVFSSVGDGTWKSAAGAVVESLRYCEDPWLTLAKTNLEASGFQVADEINGKSTRIFAGESTVGATSIDCLSATDLTQIQTESIDLVITDPPFGGLLHYSELADFFYVWLRLLLKYKYPAEFTAEFTPKALEAVANRARNPNDSDSFYQKILTECWREAGRILKPSGILAFTFHHSEDEPWVAVLESLFEAGFVLESTYPVRADTAFAESARPGAFGSQQIEYDIIHVCRKRTSQTQEVSWARLRRQITQDVSQLQDILTKHQVAGLQAADLQVIRRGKALEYYSKHYGKVYVERGRDFSVREALLAINQLLDDQSDVSTEAPPVIAEAYTRQFFRLFADLTSLPRDQMQKYLRGTGVSPQEFIDRGWCVEKAKLFMPVSPLDWAQSLRGIRRDAVNRDFDQVMFMVGACFENSGLKLTDTLNNPNFSPHPANSDLLDWLTRHGGNATIKDAAKTALQLYRSWQVKNVKKVEEQRLLFDLSEEGA